MKIFYFKIILKFLTNNTIWVPIFYINDQLEDVISSVENQSLPKLVVLPKSSKNLLILFYCI